MPVVRAEILDSKNELFGQVVQTEGDGNCFFRAIAKALTSDSSISEEQELGLANRLRKDACEELSRNRQIYYAATPGSTQEEKDEFINKYLEQMSKPGVDVEGYLIDVLAMMLNVDLVILGDNNDEVSLSQHVQIETDQQKGLVVLLYSKIGNTGHYELVQFQNIEKLNQVMSNLKDEKFKLIRMAECEDIQKKEEHQSAQRFDSDDIGIAVEAEKTKIAAQQSEQQLPKGRGVLPKESSPSQLQPITLKVRIFKDLPPVTINYEVAEFNDNGRVVQSYKLPNEDDLKKLFKFNLPKAASEPSPEELLQAKAMAAAALVQQLGLDKVRLVGNQNKWPAILKFWQDFGVFSEEQIRIIIANNTKEQQTVLTASLSAKSSHAMSAAEAQEHGADTSDDKSKLQSEQPKQSDVPPLSDEVKEQDGVFYAPPPPKSQPASPKFTALGALFEAHKATRAEDSSHTESALDLLEKAAQKKSVR